MVNSLTRTTKPDEDFLYMQIADRLGSQINQLILRTGEKLPSVRALSQEQGISLSTAYKAYVQLEIRGLIEARPKSGYYVRYTPARSFNEPKRERLAGESEKVSLDEMIAMVYRNFSADSIVKLSMASPALSLLPLAKLNKSMAEAVRLSADSCISYEAVQGNANLRTHIARQAFAWGGNILPDDVVTTQGCMEALVFCLSAVTKPGDVVAIECPTYFGIFSTVQSLGLKIVEIPTSSTEGPDLDYLAKAINLHQIKVCLFVPTFSNPLGYCMTNEKKKKLVELLAKNEVPLIEDDIYGEMYFGRTRPRTCKSYDAKGLVMLCSSVSKTLAPGYRVGWCIPGRFKAQIINLKLMHSLSSASPTHAAIGHFFETGRYDLHMRNLRKALHTQCLRYTQAITEYFPDDVKVSRPEGGYVLWIELNKKVDAFELYKQAIAFKISISPGQIFSTDSRFTNFIRISFGTPYNEEIDKSLKKLGQLMSEF
ncbi:aminotransferase-like domain-containing protein [Mucilaginibacter xinganensis]|uniref:GntR family transcriptional regulator n=1 Tax=Mucilaginibacter xinganensis TaxID=1234841 RepID=A0A223NWE9_9SPHI|nr:PLP-dependent aminotransferase family protein [Mucilaginibacter xinganensis]ASU34187.1 GntR family transcriptional regulator [Mucilaginibacter xinganensis]